MSALTDRRFGLSPIGFRLTDDLTGSTPIGPVDCVLLASDDAGGWVPSNMPAQRSAGGLITFPSLGRTARRGLTGASTRRYRARFVAAFYIWHNQSRFDGYDFDVHPFNDAEPPPGLTGIPVEITLVPAPNYPFPTELRVLHGTVVGPDGPVANAEVTRGNVDRALTDARGEWALALRQPPLAGPVTIDAADHRTNRVGHITVQLPDALSAGQTIAIS
jgi:hypothetical protein